MRSLQRMLANQFVKVTRARTCREAASVVAKPEPPHLIFTDAEVPDGTWADVLQAAQAASAAVNVIVVVRTGEVKHYLEAVQRGVFDVIAPPFSDFDLAHIVKNAVEHVLERRRLFPQSPVNHTAQFPPERGKHSHAGRRILGSLRSA